MTSGDGEWVVLRRRVSLGGHVLRGDGVAASGGVVRLAAVGPADTPAAAPGRRAHARGAMPQVQPALPAPGPHRPVIETPIRRDGSYFYLDLPAGDYAVDAVDERGRKAEARVVAVPAADRTRRPALAAVDLTIATVGAAHPNESP